MPTIQTPTCDTLILVAVSSEETAFVEQAKLLGVDVKKIRKTESLGTYYSLGVVGTERVIAVRSRVMGALSFGGSAELAARYRRVTGATSIIQLGMAFGIDSNKQDPGDVLVSTHVIPYDHRNYEELEGGGYRVSYHRTEWMPSSESTVSRLMRERSRNPKGRDYSVHFGGMLSGAAIVDSQSFRDELCERIPAGDTEIVGGEMEGIGLLGVAEEPIWCVVKGISDFADSRRSTTIERDRPIACGNAARFLLESMLNDIGDGQTAAT